MDALTRVPVPVNEPVLTYAPGSAERAALEVRLAELAAAAPVALDAWIGGERRPGKGEKLEVRMPSDHAHVLGTLKAATQADARAAVDAALAAALVVATRTVCGDEPGPRLAVIAMGKCGARELNYVSDVDVIFVAEAADSVTTRVAGEMMRFAGETFFEVDAALRPEGKAGPLVRTLASHTAYYEKWAKNWEFQAMLKARPAAGDLELGQAFVDVVWPHVWRAGERPDFVTEAQAMRDRVISLIPPKQADAEIKLGKGGLRDTEFSVQLLQLVHGRADERLRVRGTFAGLRELVAAGYIGRAVALLQETGAANVGGLMDAQGTTPLSEAIAAGYNSPLGLGGGGFHLAETPAGPADTVFLGVFRADVLREIGGFDESLHRAQDWELNYRLRRAGHLVYFSPDLQVVYRPRDSVSALARQFYRTGQWRREVIRRHPDTASLRYLAPPLTVVGTGGGLVLGLLGLVLRSRVLTAALIAPAVYVAFVGAATASMGHLRPAARLRMPIVLTIMHLAWGAGFIHGRPTGA